MTWFLVYSDIFGLQIQHWVPVFATIFAVWMVLALLGDHQAGNRR